VGTNTKIDGVAMEFSKNYYSFDKGNLVTEESDPTH
jgi:hypothetical protein